MVSFDPKRSKRPNFKSTVDNKYFRAAQKTANCLVGNVLDLHTMHLYNDENDISDISKYFYG